MIKESFRKYLEDAIGHENALIAFSAFDEPASVAVRYNPFKNTPKMEGEPVLWSKHGILLGERPVFTLDPSFHAGAYYVQDSSSMFVGDVFRKVSIVFKVELAHHSLLHIVDILGYVSLLDKEFTFSQPHWLHHLCQCLCPFSR